MAEAERSSPQSPALGVAEPEASTEGSPARREWRARIRNVLYPVGIVLGVLVIWEVATRMLEVPAFLLPPPSAIAVSFVANASLLLFHGWITTAEILLGFAQHRGRDSAGAGDLPVADVLSLGLATAGVVTGHAESGGRAAVPGLVWFRTAAESPYRVPDRLLSGGHQHCGRTCF